MMINKDQHAGHTMRVVFAKDGGEVSFSGPVHEAIFGSEQYHWSPAHRDFDAHLPLTEDNVAKLYTGGSANPDGPIAERDFTAGKETQYELPPASIVVVRGGLAVQAHAPPPPHHAKSARAGDPGSAPSQK